MEGFELKHLLTTLERTRSVGTISAGFKQVFYIAAQGVEITSGFVGGKSQGFTAQLHQQDEEMMGNQPQQVEEEALTPVMMRQR